MTARERLLLLASPRPDDLGCDEVLELLDEYVELVAAGEDPEERLPGVTAHLAGCGPCLEDYRGLLAALGVAPDDGAAPYDA